MPVQPSGCIQNHVLLYRNPLVLAQPEMRKRAKSIYYEVCVKDSWKRWQN